MAPKVYRSFLPCGVATASTILALLLTLWLEPFTDRTIGAFFYMAIIVSTWYGGTRPGILAIVLSLLSLNYYFMPPRHQFWGTAPDDLLRLSIFTSVALVITLLSANLKQSKHKIEILSHHLQAESSDRLKTALKAAQMGMWDWDITTGHIRWSPEHERLFGLAPGQFDGCYETFDACLHPDDREGLNQAVTDALKHRVSYQHEFRVVWADGSIHWIEGRGKAFYNELGDAVQMSGTVMAIDQRKQTELALEELNKELEQRIQERTAELTITNDRLLESLMEQQHTQLILWEQAQLLDLAHDTILTRDLNSVITFWNQGAERTYGWTKEEALGQDSHTLLKTQFFQPLEEIQATLSEQGYWEGELVYVSRENRPLTVSSRWVMQKDQMNRPIKILEINNDITARKQAELALQQYTREVEDLYNKAPCGYHSLDAEGTIIRINDTELSWLGYTREEVVSKKKFVDLLIPESQKTFYDNFPLLKQRGWVNDLEFQMLSQDGTIRWVSLSETAVRNEDGSFIMSRSTLFDITERRKVDQMKRDFISVVSHELRTPLTSIRGSLGLVAGGVYDKKPEKMKEMIAIAARQSDRLVRLVNDILNLRRLESGQTQFHFKQWAAAELIQQSVEVMRSQADQSQITLAIVPTDLEVWADGDAIVQTLTNLLSNAIKFSPPDSTITVSTNLYHPPTSLHPFTRFVIRDQGRGIPTHHLKTIFGQFQQVDASDSREKGGTGLGLAICRTIIDHHGGKIWAESGPGQGSTFYFTVPAQNRTFIFLLSSKKTR